MNEFNMKRIDSLFEQLVPRMGVAATKAGEIVRATCRLGFRFYNDGDQLGIDYGKETCNAAGRFLQESTTPAISALIDDLWGLYNEELYEVRMDRLIEAVLAFLEAHPELRTESNQVDMWSFQIPEDTEDDTEDEGWY